MRRTSMRQRAAYLGSCTNQIGLNMSGAPPTVGRKGSLGRYIGSRVQSNQKYCGPVMYQGQIWKTNDEPCVKKVPRGESFNSGVGHIGAPRFLCNKNCKTDTQQTIFHAPIENGDTALPGGPLGGVEDDLLVEMPIETSGLWIEKPGVYQGEGSLFSPNDLLNPNKMTMWIKDLILFIETNEIKKVIMRLPSISESSLWPKSKDGSGYVWSNDSFWDLMSGYPNNAVNAYKNTDQLNTWDEGKTGKKFPGETPTANWPSIIFSLEKITKTSQATQDVGKFQKWTLAYLMSQIPDLQWLWLPGENAGPFIGRNSKIRLEIAPSTGDPGVDTYYTFKTAAGQFAPESTKCARAGLWRWNDYNGVQPTHLIGTDTKNYPLNWSHATRVQDLSWDMVSMVEAVQSFAEKRGVIDSGIVWELEGIAGVWSNYMNTTSTCPDVAVPCQTYSIEMLIDVLYRISRSDDPCDDLTTQCPYSKGRFSMDEHWTWGLTSYAKFGGLSGINNVATIWAAWNYIALKDKSTYNIEYFVEWYGSVAKATLQNGTTNEIRKSFNTARHHTIPGLALMEGRMGAGKDVGKDIIGFLPTGGALGLGEPFKIQTDPGTGSVTTKDPTEYDLFQKYTGYIEVLANNLANNLCMTSNKYGVGSSVEIVAHGSGKHAFELFNSPSHPWTSHPGVAETKGSFQKVIPPTSGKLFGGSYLAHDFSGLHREKLVVKVDGTVLPAITIGGGAAGGEFDFTRDLNAAGLFTNLTKTQSLVKCSVALSKIVPGLQHGQDVYGCSVIGNYVRDFLNVVDLWDGVAKLLPLPGKVNVGAGPKYTALISIEPFFMGGPPVHVSAKARGQIASTFTTPTWKAMYSDFVPLSTNSNPTQGGPVTCTSYFPDKWDPTKKTKQVSTWISEVAKTAGFISKKGYGGTSSFMYYSQTYTMAPFADSETYITKERLPLTNTPVKDGNGNYGQPYTTFGVYKDFMDYPSGDLNPKPPKQKPCSV